MANTYTQIYLHFVFAVQNRMSLIKSEWKKELYKYIAGIIKNNNHKLLAINGMPDHLHIFLGYKPHQSIPELLQDIKGSSSKWINQNAIEFGIRGRFNWQQGYGAFSYSQSQTETVIRYINNQEEHHKKLSFYNEYIDMLKSYNIDYNEKYFLHEIE